MFQRSANSIGHCTTENVPVAIVGFCPRSSNSSRGISRPASDYLSPLGFSATIGLRPRRSADRQHTNSISLTPAINAFETIAAHGIVLDIFQSVESVFAVISSTPLESLTITISAPEARMAPSRGTTSAGTGTGQQTCRTGLDVPTQPVKVTRAPRAVSHPHRVATGGQHDHQHRAKPRAIPGTRLTVASAAGSNHPIRHHPGTARLRWRRADRRHRHRGIGPGRRACPRRPSCRRLSSNTGKTAGGTATDATPAANNPAGSPATGRRSDRGRQCDQYEGQTPGPRARSSDGRRRVGRRRVWLLALAAPEGIGAGDRSLACGHARGYRRD